MSLTDAIYLNIVKKTCNGFQSPLPNDNIVLKNNYIRSGRCAVQGTLLKAPSALSFGELFERVPDVLNYNKKASYLKGGWLFCCLNGKNNGNINATLGGKTPLSNGLRKLHNQYYGNNTACYIYSIQTDTESQLFPACSQASVSKKLLLHPTVVTDILGIGAFNSWKSGLPSRQKGFFTSTVPLRGGGLPVRMAAVPFSLLKAPSPFYENGLELYFKKKKVSSWLNPKKTSSFCGHLYGLVTRIRRRLDAYLAQPSSLSDPHPKALQNDMQSYYPVSDVILTICLRYLAGIKKRPGNFGIGFKNLRNAKLPRGVLCLSRLSLVWLERRIK